jgi:hypothetical protein
MYRPGLSYGVVVRNHPSGHCAFFKGEIQQLFDMFNHSNSHLEGTVVCLAPFDRVSILCFGFQICQKLEMFKPSSSIVNAKPT